MNWSLNLRFGNAPARGNDNFDAVYSLFKGVLQTGVVILSFRKFVGFFYVDL